VAVAQSQIPAQSVAWQSGTITAIYETTIQIDGRTFSLAPDAVILDDTGNQMDASELVVTAEVKYHVKPASQQASKQDSKQDNTIEQQDKIDRMIVVLPR
jgi:glucan-binding YG repeat protein